MRLFANTVFVIKKDLQICSFDNRLNNFESFLPTYVGNETVGLYKAIEMYIETEAK